MPSPNRNRRHLLKGAAAAFALNAYGISGALAASNEKAQTPTEGGALTIALASDLQALTSAFTFDPIMAVSGKIFDGLLTYDKHFAPQPQLARSWSTSSDGLTLTLHLRPDVTWHDGKPFSSADVAYSVMHIWKVYHPRGRTTFANVTTVETPDASTAVLRLSKPAPYLLTALGSTESQVLPKHLYAGTDPLTNPHNAQAVGTGPFRVAKWRRGDDVVLTRNPDYWNAGTGHAHPYLDRIVFRRFADQSAAVAALESGQVHLLADNSVPYTDLARLRTNPALRIDPTPREYGGGVITVELNLDRPQFQDVRVRHALAHAIDRNFILKNIWFGNGVVVNTPIPPDLPDFSSTDTAVYDFDPKKAIALLDAANLKPDAQGVRLRFTVDPDPYQPHIQMALYLRSAWHKIGVAIEVRNQDLGAYVKRIYTDRQFDCTTSIGSAGPDPAIGIQRFFWSKGFHPGIPYSNATHYANADVDRLLEAAQVELDPARRRTLYLDFQKIVEQDLPRIPILAPAGFAVSTRRLHDALTLDGEGSTGNFARAWLAKA